MKRIVFVSLVLLLTGIVSAGLPGPEGKGEYTNLCGSGYAATFYDCPADCDTTDGSCSGQTVYRYTCQGRTGECRSSEEDMGTYSRFEIDACGVTQQIDVFRKDCRVNGDWVCSPSDLTGYMVWYSGDCDEAVCDPYDDMIFIDSQGAHIDPEVGEPFTVRVLSDVGYMWVVLTQDGANLGGPDHMGNIDGRYYWDWDVQLHSEGSHSYRFYMDAVNDNPSVGTVCQSGSVLVDHAGYCGDGVIDAGEQCDDGAQNGNACTPPYDGQCSYCSNACTFITREGGYCGDDIFQPADEECEAASIIGEPGYHEYCTSSCTIGVPQKACLTGYKKDAAGQGLPDWTINLESLDSSYVSSDMTSGTGYYEFRDIDPGTYRVSEQMQSGWEVVPGWQKSYVVELAGGGSCENQNFVNKQTVVQKACVVGKKVDDAHVGLPGWMIHAQPVGGGTILTDTTDGTGSFRFDDMEPGQWRFWEEMQPGWEPVTAADFTVGVEAGSCEQIRFKNRQTQKAYCGDGTVDAGEECDEGSQNGVICTPSYEGECSYCSSSCEVIDLQGGYCGDGQFQPDYEECEYEAGPGDSGYHKYCTVSCTFDEQDMTCIEAKDQGLITADIIDGRSVLYNDADQSFDVGMATYEMYDWDITNQVLFDFDLGTVPAHGQVTLQTQIPMCAYQIEVFCGHEVIEDLKPDAYGRRVIDWTIFDDNPFCREQDVCEPGEDMFTSVRDIPATCNGDIVVDEWHACRTIECVEDENRLIVLACDKPDSDFPDYFEVYKQVEEGQGLQICIGDVCINGNGFARSDAFPYCADSADFISQAELDQGADDSRSGFVPASEATLQEDVVPDTMPGLVPDKRKAGETKGIVVQYS